MTSKTDEQAAKIVGLTLELQTAIKTSSNTALKKAQKALELLYINFDLKTDDLCTVAFYAKVILLVEKTIEKQKS